ncbi:DUF3365 domain-containing protein [Fodinibius sp.]|uniref:Tll0287-like domain-containing protein n=1 Tax=Fodinibius sp. TaxID=1872440 RepID=UPI002ACED747|nr:DUF3365 domain-containing protein [Fodinibius sp.]MDZ7660434.1 DUF3365 domain-containing protein [Fodinibius sp.]
MRYGILIAFILAMGYGCQSESQEQTDNKLAYDTTVVVNEGQKIAKATFQTLSSNLQKAMQEGGVEYALEFCNVEAMPLTDSLSAHHDVSIRRASHKPRNPYNTADSLEAEVIKQYIKKLESGDKLQPVTYADENRITFHAPITITNSLCLNCHGKVNEDISKENLATIQELYPKDQATGFSMGDLRGVWTIRFPATHFDDADIQQLKE